MSANLQHFHDLLLAVIHQSLWAVFCLTLAGGILFFIGTRTERLVAQVAGLLLQFGALYLLLAVVWYPFQASLFLNTYFGLSSSIAFSVLLSAYYLERGRKGVAGIWDRMLFLLLFLVGATGWYAGGIREIYMHIVVAERLSGVLLLISGTSILAGLIAENIKWKRLNLVLLLQLPAMLLIVLLELVSGPPDYPLLTGWGATVWPITLFVQYRILGVLEWSKSAMLYHLISLLILVFVSSRELVLKATQLYGLSISSVFLLEFLLVFVWCSALYFMVKKKYWPASAFPCLYLWGGGGGVILLFLFSVVKMSMS